MLHFDFDRLQRVGLTAALAARARSCAAEDGSDGLALLRITSVHRETVQLHDGLSSMAARSSPRLTRALLDAGTALAVGDWALISRDASGERWLQQRGRRRHTSSGAMAMAAGTPSSATSTTPCS